MATKRSHQPPRWSPWTPARIDALKAHWSKGLNARAIARELKHGVTRAAVLGKIRRLGIADLAPAVVEPRTVQRAARKAKRSRTESARRVVPSAIPRRLASAPITLWRPRSVPSWVLEARPSVDDPGRDVDIPRLQRRTFAQLNRAACRWPIGDPSHPDFFFCGAPRSAGKPFCPAHCERAYRDEQQGEGK